MKLDTRGNSAPGPRPLQLLDPAAEGPLTVPSTARAPWASRAVRAALGRLADGALLLDWRGELQRLGEGPVRARVAVHDERFWSAVAMGGSIGAGEAYAKGWWTSPDPTGVVRLMVRERQALDAVDGGLSRLARPLRAVLHALRRNTRRGSRSNIAAHYDLSNAFFALFLDETMTYSCGIFEDEHATLREASVAKIDRLCRKLDLRPEHHLLEIGTGWGALALHAAREYGCRVTTTTISRRQHELAVQRVREAGLEDRVTLLLQDYRDLEGTYDRIVSVEMIEAVGHRYYETFYRKCAELLAPDGLFGMQAILIADHAYEQARDSVDFIQRHIFPGCCIPSVSALTGAMGRASDLSLVHLEDFGVHYARTLASWRANLRERWDDARALGLDDTFLRLWEFYFCYCEGGFEERHISVAQMVHARPRAWTRPLLQPLPTAPPA